MIDLLPVLELYSTYSHDEIFFDIAENIVEQYNDLKLDSLSSFADSLHVSNSSVSRFIKQLYYENFTLFKMEHMRRDEQYFFDFAYMQGQIQGLRQGQGQSHPPTFQGYVDAMLHEVRQIATTVSEEQINHLCEQIIASDSVVFVGIPLCSDIWWLQVDLVLMGKKTSAFFDPNYQVEAIRNLKPNTLVIGIDIIRQDDNFIYNILAEAKKGGAKVCCISHFKKSNSMTFVDEHLHFNGTNTRTDNYVLSVILNYIGNRLRMKNLE